MRRLCLDSTGIDVSECRGTQNTFEECGITPRDFNTCRGGCSGARRRHPEIMCLSGKHFAHNSLSKCRYELQPTVLMER